VILRNRDEEANSSVAAWMASASRRRWQRRVRA